MSARSSAEWVETIEQNFGNADGILEIARQATVCCPSIEVWLAYQRVLAARSDREFELSELQRGIEATGLWLDSSHLLWNIYAGLLDDEDIVSAYMQRLRVPHLDLDETFSTYSSRVSARSDYSDIMASASAIVEKTRRLLRDRERWEYARPIAYRKYLEWELERFQSNARFDFCIPLFERILTRLPTTDKAIWVRYVRHLWFNKKRENMFAVLKRGLSFFSDDRILQSLLLRVAIEGDDQKLVEHYAKEFDATNVPELQEAYFSWKSNLALANSSVKLELQAALETKAFNPAVPLGRLSVFSALMAKLGNSHIARKAWHKQAKLHPESEDLWRNWVNFELTILDREERLKGVRALWNTFKRTEEVSHFDFVIDAVRRFFVVSSLPLEAELVASEGQTSIWVGGGFGGPGEPELSEESVRGYFSEFGTIVNVRIPRDREFCYVQYSSALEARRAALEGNTKGIKVRVSANSSSRKPVKRLSSKVQTTRETLTLSNFKDSDDLSEVLPKILSNFNSVTIAKEELKLSLSFPSEADAGKAHMMTDGIALKSGSRLRAALS